MENYQLKADIEQKLDEVLHEMAAQRTPPTLWQVDCFLESLWDCRRGFYARACNYALDVMATNVADRPFSNRTAAKVKELEGISLVTLRAGLMAVKVLPVFERVNHAPMEIISDWVRKQPERFRLWEPA